MPLEPDSLFTAGHMGSILMFCELGNVMTWSGLQTLCLPQQAHA